MKKNLKKIVAVALTATVIAGVSFAQTTPQAQTGDYFPMALSSNKDYVTMGVWGTDTDDFMSTTGWAGVNLEKVFAALDLATSYLGVGASGKIGDLYLGGFYRGNVVNRYALNGTGNVDREESNTVGLLFGFGRLGIKATFDEYARAPISSGGTLQYFGADSDGNGGLYTPALEVGYVLPLDKLTVEPVVSLAFPIYSDVKILQPSTAYTGMTGIREMSTLFDKQVIGVQPQLAVTLGFGNAVKQSVKIAYTLTAYVGDKDENNVDSVSRIDNKIQLKYAAKYTWNKLKVGGGIDFQMEFRPVSWKEKGATDPTKLLASIIEPSAFAGISYDFTEKFSLNLGARYIFVGLHDSLKTPNGNTTEKDTAWNTYSIGAFGLGFTSNVNEHFCLDVALWNGTTAEDNGGFGSSFDEILSQLSIQGTIKF